MYAFKENFQPALVCESPTMKAKTRLIEMRSPALSTHTMITQTPWYFTFFQVKYRNWSTKFMHCKSESMNLQHFKADGRNLMAHKASRSEPGTTSNTDDELFISEWQRNQIKNKKSKIKVKITFRIFIGVIIRFLSTPIRTILLIPVIGNGGEAYWNC